MNLGEFKSKLNKWGREKVPFLFVVDFELERPLVWRIDEIDPAELLFDFRGIGNANHKIQSARPVVPWAPLPFQKYREKFDLVTHHLLYGDSFLTNLTIATEVKLNQSLRDLFFASRAHYKLWMENLFLVFSPETFVTIRDGKIFTHPMKGTIDAAVPNAHHKLIADQKEKAEHITIVDLMRNDLSQIATNVKVERFRYIDEIKTTSKTLLQVSSEISGRLPIDYPLYIGDILLALLPAGSVSGAPKPKTLEIIKKAEGKKRGYYTGVCGCFDGTNLDSGVMIRFIEQADDKYFYRSGGGITTQSDALTEYEEALDKIYVPID